MIKMVVDGRLRDGKGYYVVAIFKGENIIDKEEIGILYEKNRSNIVELNAILKALRIAKRSYKDEYVTIITDSKSSYELITGKAKGKKNTAIVNQCRKLYKQLPKVSLIWKSRKNVRYADKVARFIDG
ncbi:reverse transcriptase-like protein [Marinitoga litoralis]|uniref:reverse transcriptase-like protein n=1 Tax=Marinitoga litoralis TaxID=570855 RepID=UPI00195F5FBF|nr:reverse transcriptase-like protein [Marinitoga litoralis]MBM7560471.1 ribonuclease HI [Marinitoga litoralis]